MQRRGDRVMITTGECCGNREAAVPGSAGEESGTKKAPSSEGAFFACSVMKLPDTGVT
jgi:hypothetical protein